MEKRSEVFISSTYANLKNERKKGMEAILECGCFPSGMDKNILMPSKREYLFWFL